MRPDLRALPAALALTAVVALAGCSGGDVSAQPGGQTWVQGAGVVTFVDSGERRRAPGLAGDLLDGGTLDVRDLTGDVVVLNFWASWCPPCRAEAAELEAVFEKTAPSGVRFVGVAMRDDRQAARRFVEVRGVSYPSFFDPGGMMVARLRGMLPPVALPSTIVLDRSGRIAVRVVGPVTEAELLPMVQRVAQETA